MSNNWKVKGNQAFASDQFEDAIEYYTKAIICDPTVSVFYTNRALCFVKLEKWDNCVQDARKALELDENSIKGNYYLGLALLRLDPVNASVSGGITECVRVLRKAYDLGIREQVTFMSEIGKLLMEAKKRKWKREDQMYRREKNELHVFLHKLIIQHFNKNSVNNTTGLQGASENGTALLEEERRLSQLETLFGQLDENMKDKSVPDYFCGKITLNLMQDPVITPDGITYDREELLAHFKTNGYFDPFTRHKLHKEKLIPNLALKEALEEFISKNGWAIDF